MSRKSRKRSYEPTDKQKVQAAAVGVVGLVLGALAMAAFLAAYVVIRDNFRPSATWLVALPGILLALTGVLILASRRD